MTLKEELNREIATYWWNFGSKTKDFEGTYKQWFDKHKITIRQTKLRLIYKGSFGSMDFRIELTKDYVHGFNHIIKLCHVYLGDKALLIDGFNRQYKINWR